MRTENLKKEARTIFTLALAAGALLLLSGILLNLLDLKLLANNRALIGLSLIPFSIAALYLWKYLTLKNHPEKIRGLIVSESDERLVQVKNEADTKAFRLTQALIFLAYMGYTFAVPEDIFESPGWWLLLLLLLFSFLGRGLFLAGAMKRNDGQGEE